MRRRFPISIGVHLIAGSLLVSSGWIPAASAVPDEPTAADSVQAAVEELLPWQLTLTGQDSVRVAELDSLITVLREQAKYAEAVPLAEEILEIHQRVQGTDHWQAVRAARLVETLAYVASLSPEAQAELAEADRASPAIRDFDERGTYDEALLLAQRQLEIRKRFLGDKHLDVALSMHYAAWLLRAKRDYVAAETLFRESLAIHRKLLGDAHPDVACCKNDLAVLLSVRGDYDGAEPLYRETLATYRKVFGGEHPFVAQMLNNAAVLIMKARGDYAGAEPLLREALEMIRKLEGDEHWRVALVMSNLGRLLCAKGDYPGAEPLLREALAMRRKLLGDEDPDVAKSLNNLAGMLYRRGDYAGAEPLYREALAMWRKLLGEEHPGVAQSLHNLAASLHAKGDYVSAEPLYQEALAMRRKLLGEEHPDVAQTLHDLAGLLFRRGDCAGAETLWVAAAESFEAARARMSASGLERAHYGAESSPQGPLAVCLARNGKPLSAWSHLEANLARGLLDEISARAGRLLGTEERGYEQNLLSQLSGIDERISALLAAQGLRSGACAKADTLRWEQEALQAELVRFEADVAAKYGVAAGETYELARIQEVLPADVALVAWVDMKGDSNAADPNGEHWACVVRHQGEPVWVKLPGSGGEGSWTEADNELPARVREAMRGEEFGSVDVLSHELVADLYAQRIAPAEPHLSDVNHLIVLPGGWMAGVPVEVLANDYTVSYAPSATMYTWLREKSAEAEEERELEEGRELFALGDPVFREPEEPEPPLPEPPEHGVLLAMVMEESNAARSGLEAGDVLLSYGEDELGGPDDFGPAIETAQEIATGEAAIPVRVWRGGEALDLSVAPGKLGVRPSSQPAPEAIRAKRQLDEVLERTRGPSFAPLPASRLEVESLASLFTPEANEAGPTILLGPDASERRVDELTTSGELGRYRFIHLATHAVMDDERAMQSALILSQDPVDDSFERAVEGKEVYDGRLTGEQIVRTWKLDADLVTLSGCETALGKESGGEGYLGFSQALFVAGARSLVLSLWKVEDTPTMLLMRRFYENLLGRFDDVRSVAGHDHLPASPLPKAEALREAKEWLRTLTWDDVADLVAELGGGGTRGPAVEDVAVVAGDSDYPYEHPHYWASFILMGNPD